MPRRKPKQENIDNKKAQDKIKGAIKRLIVYRHERNDDEKSGNNNGVSDFERNSCHTHNNKI